MTTAEREIVLVQGSKQQAFVNDETPFAAAVAGLGSGKTYAGALKAVRYCWTHPNALGMVTAPTFPMLRDTTLRTVKEVLPEGSYTLNKTEMHLTLANGAELLFRSTENSEHLRGVNAAFVWMDEAAQSPAEAFKILQGRLRQPGFPHQLWLTTTPKGFNWVYAEFGSPEAVKRPEYKLITWSARDNPFLTDDYVRRLEESYDPDFALQEIDGQFVAVGGKLFFNFEALRAMYEETREPDAKLSSKAAIRVWRQRVLGRKYVAGGDLAWGEKGAYSCLTVLDWQTGEQVAEIHGRLPADEMALETVKLCREYNDAYLGVEWNGEGRVVVNKIIDLGYKQRMFYRDYEAKAPDKPGWLTDLATRPMMLGELEEAVRLGSVRPACRDAVSEMMAFVRNDKGRPGKPEDQSKVYDDHVMSWAIAWQMRKHARYSVAGTVPPPLPTLW